MNIIKFNNDLDKLNEGAQGHKRPGYEWVIYDASQDNFAPIIAIRKTYTEAQYFINKHFMDYDFLSTDEVPEGKFKVGDDFWGPFDADYKPLKEDYEEELFTPEEQEEYDCDELGYSNNSYDRYHHCGFCNEIYPESEMKNEADFGWLCSRCIDDIHWHGGKKLKFIEESKQLEESNKEDKVWLYVADKKDPTKPIAADRENYLHYKFVDSLDALKPNLEKFEANEKGKEIRNLIAAHDYLADLKSPIYTKAYKLTKHPILCIYENGSYRPYEIKEIFELTKDQLERIYYVWEFEEDDVIESGTYYPVERYIKLKVKNEKTGEEKEVIIDKLASAKNKYSKGSLDYTELNYVLNGLSWLLYDKFIEDRIQDKRLQKEVEKEASVKEESLEEPKESMKDRLDKYVKENEKLEEGASYRGLTYYEYPKGSGCHVRETPEVFVAISESGKTLGQEKTKIGAEAIIDEYLKNKCLKEDCEKKLYLVKVSHNPKWMKDDGLITTYEFYACDEKDAKQQAKEFDKKCRVISVELKEEKKEQFNEKLNIINTDTLPQYVLDTIPTIEKIIEENGVLIEDDDDTPWAWKDYKKNGIYAEIRYGGYSGRDKKYYLNIFYRAYTDKGMREVGLDYTDAEKVQKPRWYKLINDLKEQLSKNDNFYAVYYRGHGFSSYGDIDVYFNVKQGRKLQYEDDLVKLYRNGKEVYKGIFDYCFDDHDEFDNFKWTGNQYEATDSENNKWVLKVIDESLKENISCRDKHEKEIAITALLPQETIDKIVNRIEAKYNVSFHNCPLYWSEDKKKLYGYILGFTSGDRPNSFLINIKLANNETIVFQPISICGDYGGALVAQNIPGLIFTQLDTALCNENTSYIKMLINEYRYEKEITKKQKQSDKQLKSKIGSTAFTAGRNLNRLTPEEQEEAKEWFKNNIKKIELIYPTGEPWQTKTDGTNIDTDTAEKIGQHFSSLELQLKNNFGIDVYKNKGQLDNYGKVVFGPRDATATIENKLSNYNLWGNSGIITFKQSLKNAPQVIIDLINNAKQQSIDNNKIKTNISTNDSGNNTTLNDNRLNSIYLVYIIRDLFKGDWDLLSESLEESIEGTPKEGDYEKLAKKYQKTNKKGARGTFERVANTDPEKNMEIFNHMMGSDAYSNAGEAVAGEAGGEGAAMGEAIEYGKGEYIINYGPYADNSKLYNKYQNDARQQEYYVLKTSQDYDPEGLYVNGGRGQNIIYAGSKEECEHYFNNYKREAYINSKEPMPSVKIEKEGKDFISLYFPFAISKATVYLVKNENYKPLEEDTHSKYSKPEGDKIAAYNNALKYAKKDNVPYIYGYTNKRLDNKFFALEQPIKGADDMIQVEKEFRNRYKNCGIVYVVYPDKNYK